MTTTIGRRWWCFPLLLAALGVLRPVDAQPPRSFRVWVFADAHVGTDAAQGRQSLAEAIRQSESPAGFEWDVALDLGDVSGAQGTPKDLEGEELVRQFGALTRHRREQVYDVSGNHDRSGLDEPQGWWWRKWVDPTGEHTATSGVDRTKRPYAIDGTWERYSFRVGTLLFLMMSDINEPTQKIGRGPLGGNPGGVVSGETFDWWKRMVAANPESIVVTAHHYVLKDTTVASGEWEGMTKGPDGKWESSYHGYYPRGTPQGASFLYWVDSKPDSGAFERVLAGAPSRVDLWLGAHTHTTPDDMAGNKSHVERRWGTTFINVSGLTRYHGPAANQVPRSWLLTFTEGSDEMAARCYLHSSEYAGQGWYESVRRTVKLSKPFKPDGFTTLHRLSPPRTTTVSSWRSASADRAAAASVPRGPGPPCGGPASRRPPADRSRGRTSAGSRP